MIRHLLLVALTLGVAPALLSAEPKLLKTESIPGKGVWIDPAAKAFSGDEFRVTVWFEEQFLGDGESYLRRSTEFAGVSRITLRRKVRDTLKSLSRRSLAAAHEKLEQLVAVGKISDLEKHWIVNGFSCRTKRSGLAALKTVPNVRMIYFAGPGRDRRSFRVSRTTTETKTVRKEVKSFSPDRHPIPWYVSALKADQVWTRHQVTGKGVLNVIHDGNFIVSPGIVPSRYRNPRESPNGQDDSGNGLVDDLHGYDFLLKRSQLTRTPMPETGRANAGVLHGHQCVAIICGRGTVASPHQFGLAPESKWAGVLAGRRIEAAVEWAADQEADTYSMSFSIPNLREYRSHWRKMMEHGACCGIHFVSGAGNFAQERSPRFAPIPVQMRTPEDIPQVVFAAAGVQQDLSRTPFSSQGPVAWNTRHYRDGKIDKPEVAAFNFRLPLLLPNGKVQAQAASGNSFAGPMFCGVIALILSANPDLQPWEVRGIIINTARDVGPKGYDHQTGHGLIDAFAAVSEAIKRRQ